MDLLPLAIIYLNQLKCIRFRDINERNKIKAVHTRLIFSAIVFLRRRLFKRFELNVAENVERGLETAQNIIRLRINLGLDVYKLFGCVRALYNYNITY